MHPGSNPKPSMKSAIRRRSRLVVLLGCVFAGELIAAKASAGVVVNIYESGGNVVATGSGTIDLAAINLEVDRRGGSGIWADVAFVGLGNQYTAVYSGISGPSSWGAGGFTSVSLASGDSFGIRGDGSAAVFVPYGYTSGSELSGSVTFTGATIASLGLNVGTYDYTWGTGSSADFFTVNVIAGSVPEPASIVLLLSGSAVVLACGRKRMHGKRKLVGPGRGAE